MLSNCFFCLPFLLMTSALHGLLLDWASDTRTPVPSLEVQPCKGAASMSYREREKKKPTASLCFDVFLQNLLCFSLSSILLFSFLFFSLHSLRPSFQPQDQVRKEWQLQLIRSSCSSRSSWPHQFCMAVVPKRFSWREREIGFVPGTQTSEHSRSTSSL